MTDLLTREQFISLLNQDDPNFVERKIAVPLTEAYDVALTRIEREREARRVTEKLNRELKASTTVDRLKIGQLQEALMSVWFHHGKEPPDGCSICDIRINSVMGNK